MSGRQFKAKMVGTLDDIASRLLHGTQYHLAWHICIYKASPRWLESYSKEIVHQVSYTALNHNVFNFVLSSSTNPANCALFNKTWLNKGLACDNWI